MSLMSVKDNRPGGPEQTGAAPGSFRPVPLTSPNLQAARRTVPAPGAGSLARA
jgi:hypothetical protein